MKLHLPRAHLHLSYDEQKQLVLPLALHLYFGEHHKNSIGCTATAKNLPTGCLAYHRGSYYLHLADKPPQRLEWLQAYKLGDCSFTLKPIPLFYHPLSWLIVCTLGWLYFAFGRPHVWH